MEPSEQDKKLFASILRPWAKPFALISASILCYFGYHFFGAVPGFLIGASIGVIIYKFWEIMIRNPFELINRKAQLILKVDDGVIEANEKIAEINNRYLVISSPFKQITLAGHSREHRSYTPGLVFARIGETGDSDDEDSDCDLCKLNYESNGPEPIPVNVDWVKCLKILKENPAKIEDIDQRIAALEESRK
jgi:hypothetical protein